MDRAAAADGTRIAYEQFGVGRAVVVVVGALSTAASARAQAQALAATGLRGVEWDCSAASDV